MDSSELKIYLVGGAIRDALLNLPIKERDWVVVGATPEQMLALNFKQVGKHFPVFLHPDTHEEYALARTERKTGPGYKGFSFHTATDVTLEEDLKRRDLTINAMAQGPNTSEIIDPYNGQADLKNRVLRHVSNAFVEDPVRILRIARFAAKFANLGFTVHPETNTLMTQMVNNGEVDSLVSERVWQELQKALSAADPGQFFQVLQDCNAYEQLFPGDTSSEQGLATLKQACELSDDPTIRFAAWTYHLDKEKAETFCEQYNAPKEYRELTLLTIKFHDKFHKCTQLPPPNILDTLKALDAFRKPERFEKFLFAAEAISKSLPGCEHHPQPQREYLHTAHKAAASISGKDMTKRLEGEELAEELDMHRRAAISKIKRTYRWAKF